MNIDTFTSILVFSNTVILLGIVTYLFIMHKYLNKNDIVEYVAQIFKISEANLKQDLNIFLQEVTKEYQNHQNEIIQLLKEQQEEVEKLKKVITNEAKAFKQYCEDRITFQEKFIKNMEIKLQDATNKISQLTNQLQKCKNKLEKAKNDSKTT